MIASKFDSNPGTLILRDGSKFRIRPKTSDRATINEVFIAKPYTPDQSFAIAEGDHILDIGANIGAFTVYAARIAKEEGIVYSVEPVASNFSALEENVKLNNLRNVRLLRAAVGGHKGFATIESRGSSSSVVWHSGGFRDRVKQITLRSLVDQIRRVDLLKMDCEGAEYDILLSTNTECLRSIRRIAMEYHNVSSDLCGETLKRHLETAGFRVTCTGTEWTGTIYAVNRAADDR
jgi:FkbM family methyltransferase